VNQVCLVIYARNSLGQVVYVIEKVGKEDEKLGTEVELCVTER
jgi:hypothetical protein